MGILRNVGFVWWVQVLCGYGLWVRAEIDSSNE